MRCFTRLAAAMAIITAFLVITVRGEPTSPLPDGVRAVWDLDAAWRETTTTRERVCLNGLWRWQPTTNSAGAPPVEQWGFFKVPGAWPGLTDYMQKDSQTVFRHQAWRDVSLAGVTMAWYERELTVPASWTGRRVGLTADTLNSFATVYIDGKKTGELRFPGGQLDLTAECKPGTHHTLSLLVIAMPLQGVLRSYTDTASAREVKGEVRRRGLCGDVFLVSSPQGARVDDVSIATSVRTGEITVGAVLPELSSIESYSLAIEIRGNGSPIAEFRSPSFKGSDLKDGHFRFSQKWQPSRLWDLHTPQNQYEAAVSLVNAQGKVLDTAAPARFGFRELWIDGRDFRLNGSRIFLSAEPFDNAQIGAALANYHSARETFERLKTFGINLVYAHNYDCQPGSHLDFGEILRAADDTGMLVALTQPHFSHYDWKSAGSVRTNSYARHAEYYVRVAGSHPSVVFYSMSHNATGYEEDMNPDLIDGLHDPRDRWSSNNAALALRAEATVTNLDPSRIVYHHASGNLGVMHSINFYPNMAPIQELDDWFGHWASQGVKPVFTCEYGAPFTWDWAMYRGWYKGQREFGSAQVPWELCIAEWNAQFFGDRAYRISEAEKADLRWEARQFQAGKLWHRWDYPVEMGSARFEERYPVFAMYLKDNWRAYRTWGISGNSPWEYGHYWKLRDGANRNREELPVDWEHLQRPGFSPDFQEERFERMDTAYALKDWVPTAAAEALYRNNGPLLAYIAGKSSAFTSKDHNFLPGENVEKQIVVINNSRVTVAGQWQWSTTIPDVSASEGRYTLATGEQSRFPVRIALPKNTPPGTYTINAEVQFGNGTAQQDSFEIHVMAPPALPTAGSRIALFDPIGEIATWLRHVAVPFKTVDATNDLAEFDILIVGKSALNPTNLAPAIGKVRDGLKVIVFEQSAATLEQRFGFRVAEYGLRTVFERIPDHPILAGIAAVNLRDWRGDATLSAPRLSYQLRPRYGSTVTWCGLPETRLWRCGNRGNVASVLIEKPSSGGFLPIVDGGFDLQYSPLLEYREGRGIMIFCQLDLIGRTESDPAAETIAANLINYTAAWKPAPRAAACYAADPACKAFLETLGLSAAIYSGGKLPSDCILAAGPDSASALSEHQHEIADWLASGGHLLAFGLNQKQLDSFLRFGIKTKTAEHIACEFDAQGRDSFAAGIGPSDVHLRAPRQLDLIAAGATTLGDGILARASNASVVFCQLAPWQIAPRGPSGEQYNLRRTRRRVSFLASRLLANLGVESAAPILSRFNEPVISDRKEQRWLSGLYADQPEEWDDPYRFFRW